MPRHSALENAVASEVIADPSVEARRTGPLARGQPSEAFRILHGIRHGRPFSASITARGPVPILSATCCWSRTVSNRDCAGIVAFLGGGFTRKTSRLDLA